MKLSFAISHQKTAFTAISSEGLAKLIAFMRVLNYDGLELAVRDPKEVNAGELMGLLGDRLRLVAIGTGQAFVDEGLSLADLAVDVRSKALERLKGQIDLASTFGARVIIGLIRGRVVAEEMRRTQTRYFEHALEQLAGYAAGRNVDLAIEPINRYETNLLNTADETMEVIDRIGSPNLNLLLDTFHMNIEEPDLVATIEKHGPRVVHIHIADSNRRYPGLGHIDFHSVRAALKRIGYRGFLSGEMLPYPDIQTAMQQYVDEMGEKYV